MVRLMSPRLSRTSFCRERVHGRKQSQAVLGMSETGYLSENCNGVWTNIQCQDFACSFPERLPAKDSRSGSTRIGFLFPDYPTLD